MRLPCFLSPVLLLTLACNGSGTLLGLSRDALTALPAVPSPRGQALTAGDALPDDFTLKQFFKLQCHHGLRGDPVVDYCPPGVPKNDDTEFNAQTLLGLIFAGDREAADIFGATYQHCGAGEGGAPATVTAASYVSSDGGNGHRFVVGLDPLLGCAAHRVWNGAYKAYLYGTQSDRRVLVASRKHDLTSAGADQTDLYEIYLGLNGAGAAHVLAFNTVGIAGVVPGGNPYDYGERAILLVNFETHRFMVKYRQNNGAFLTAAGRGGMDASGAWQPGAFSVRTDGTTAGLCADNATRLVADPSACAAEQASWSSAAEAAAYLGLTAQETSDLDTFLQHFAAGPMVGDLAADAAPMGSADAVDIPDRL